MSSRIPLAAALLLVRLCAQDPTATLVGTVDATGAVVTGAKVEIRNTETNAIKKIDSDDKSEFTAPNLTPGIYDVTVSKNGFRTLHEANLELQVEQQARLEFHLELGSMVQTVEVQSAEPITVNSPALVEASAGRLSNTLSVCAKKMGPVHADPS